MEFLSIVSINISFAHSLFKLNINLSIFWENEIYLR